MGAPRRMTVLLAASLAAAAVTGCSSNGARPANQGNPTGAPSPSALGPPPVITSAAARTALAGFAAAVTQADKLRDNHLLAAAETGTSYQIDAGIYRWTRVSDPGNRAYQALTVARSAFYIPRRSGGQRWWVATAAWTQPRRPSADPVPGYLLLTQVSGKWMLTLEPSIITGHAAMPAVVTDSAGYAAAATPQDEAQLAVPPAHLPAATAKYLNAISALGPRCPLPGVCRATPHGKIKIPSPGRLSDIHDQAFFAKRIGFGVSDLDMHTVTHDPEFTVRTSDGGALVFYDLRAELTLAPPAGFQFRVKIPGYYDGSAQLTRAALVFFDQFTTYDPPRGHGLPRVVADNAGPVSKG